MAEKIQTDFGKERTTFEKTRTTFEKIQTSSEKERTTSEKERTTSEKLRTMAEKIQTSSEKERTMAGKYASCEQERGNGMKTGLFVIYLVIEGFALIDKTQLDSHNILYAKKLSD